VREFTSLLGEVVVASWHLYSPWPAPEDNHYCYHVLLYAWK